MWYGAIGNYSIVSLGYALNGSTIGWVVAILCGLTVFCPYLWKGPIDDFFIKSVSLSLLLAPLSWINYQVLLLPCLIILSYYIHFSRKGPRWLFFLVAIVIWGWPGEFHLGSETVNILLSSLPLFATAGVFILSHYFIYSMKRD